MLLRIAAYFNFAVALTTTTVPQADSFDEELFVRFLSDGKVYAYFQFTTLWNKSFVTDTFDHSSLFPRSLAEIIQAYDVQELHISLTEGQWHHRNWGYPIVEAAAGAELWSWFRNGNYIDDKWKSFTAALSGLLCASFNFIDGTNSVKPQFCFKADGLDEESGGSQANTSRLRYATLPREIVCTENLTPWKKLLPCDHKGLSTLLNARHMHNTNYHSIGVHYRQICANNKCSLTRLELKQTVSLVYDLVMLEGSADEWSIRKLFGIALFDICPLARSSRLFVDTSSEGGTDNFNNTIELSKEPSDIIINRRGGYEGRFAVYDLNKMEIHTSPFNLFARKKKKKSSSEIYHNRRPMLHANRYILGYGKEIGGIITTIYNNHRQAINITYFENIPWFVPVYYHTLKIKHNGGGEIIPSAKHYVPGKIRSRPYHLEVVFELPPRSVVDISFDFDYMFLKWQEYPPDANHGFYVGSAVITALLPYARNHLGGFSRRRAFSSINDGWNVTVSDEILAGFDIVNDELVVQMRTESFVLGLPTPDFSMPYNVICLSCTVVALAFGPIHNIATKRLRLAKRSNKSKLRTWLHGKFAAFVPFFWRSSSVTTFLSE